MRPTKEEVHELGKNIKPKQTRSSSPNITLSTSFFSSATALTATAPPLPVGKHHRKVSPTPEPPAIKKAKQESSWKETTSKPEMNSAPSPDLQELNPWGYTYALGSTSAISPLHTSPQVGSIAVQPLSVLSSSDQHAQPTARPRPRVLLPPTNVADAATQTTYATVLAAPAPQFASRSRPRSNAIQVSSLIDIPFPDIAFPVISPEIRRTRAEVKMAMAGQGTTPVPQRASTSGHPNSAVQESSANKIPFSDILFPNLSPEIGRKTRTQAIISLAKQKAVPETSSQMARYPLTSEELSLLDQTSPQHLVTFPEYGLPPSRKPQTAPSVPNSTALSMSQPGTRSTSIPFGVRRALAKYNPIPRRSTRNRPSLPELFHRLPQELKDRIWYFSFPHLDLRLSVKRNRCLHCHQTHLLTRPISLCLDPYTVSSIAHVDRASRAEFLRHNFVVRVPSMPKPRYMSRTGALRIKEPEALSLITFSGSVVVNRGNHYGGGFNIAEGISTWRGLEIVGKDAFLGIKTITLRSFFIKPRRSPRVAFLWKPLDDHPGLEIDTFKKWVLQLSWLRSLEEVILVNLKVWVRSVNPITGRASSRFELFTQPEHKQIVDQWTKETERELRETMKWWVENRGLEYGKDVSMWWMDPKVKCWDREEYCRKVVAGYDKVEDLRKRLGRIIMKKLLRDENDTDA